MSDDGKVAELLYRVDERTARMDERIERMEIRLGEVNTEQNSRMSELEGSYEELDNRVRRNATIISGFSVGSTTVLGIIAAKLANLLNWF